MAIAIKEVSGRISSQPDLEAFMVREYNRAFGSVISQPIPDDYFKNHDDLVQDRTFVAFDNDTPTGFCVAGKIPPFFMAVVAAGIRVVDMIVNEGLPLA